jgi:hypothetical protein
MNNSLYSVVYDRNISIIFEEILIEYNIIIKQNKIIRTGFSDVENQRRFWKIVNELAP